MTFFDILVYTKKNVSLFVLLIKSVSLQKITLCVVK